MLILLQGRVLCSNVIRTSSFDNFKQLPNWIIRRTRDKQMHMVRHNFFCKQVDVMPFTNPLKSLVSDLFYFFPLKNWVSCFCYQNHMIPILPNIVGKPFYFRVHTTHFVNLVRVFHNWKACMSSYLHLIRCVKYFKKVLKKKLSLFRSP